jgi:hypothetical protein
MNSVKKYCKKIAQVGVEISIMCESCNKINILPFPRGTLHTIFNETDTSCSFCGEVFPRVEFLKLKDKVLNKSNDFITSRETERIENLNKVEVLLDRKILEEIDAPKKHCMDIINEILTDAIKDGAHLKIKEKEIFNGDENGL